MLGGDVAQIQQGANAYRVLGENLTACGTQVVSTTDGVVAGLQEQLSSAQNAVVSSVQALSEESRSVMSGLSSIVWTGTNRGQVEEVGSELDARVTETTARIQELFNTFRAELDRLGGELTEVATQFNVVALSAGDSATSLALAMDSQAVQLDEVMNTGISRA
jgi:phage-related protein